jgi:hypothetical protein
MDLKGPESKSPIDTPTSEFAMNEQKPPAAKTSAQNLLPNERTDLPKPSRRNSASIDDFYQEHMGIASKE